MKKDSPTVKLIIDKSKPRKDGRFPLYIQVLWKCMRAKEYTGINLNEKEFKSGVYKRERRLLNRLNDVEEMSVYLMSSGKEFTPSDVLESTVGKRPIVIISEMCRLKKLSSRTSTGYMTTHHSLQSYFGEDYRLEDLTLSQIQGYARTLRISPSAMAFYLKDLKSLLGYAKERGYIRENVMEKWKFKLDGFRDREKPKSRNIYEIKDYAKRWKRERDSQTKEALGIWLSGFYFNGLALVDLVKIDWESIGEKWIEGGMYYTFTTERKKTRETAHVMTPVTELTKSLLGFLKTRPWAGKRNYQAYINRILKKVDPTLTYYQCRHSFASLLVASRTPLNTIASMLGRSVNGLSTYIHRVTEESTLATAAKALIHEELLPDTETEKEVFESLID